MKKVDLSILSLRAVKCLVPVGAALLLSVPACGGSSSSADASVGGPDAPATIDGSMGMPDAMSMADASPNVLAPKAVYTLSNDANDNNILVFTRDTTTGALTSSGQYSTGGKGNGAGLGSQGALVFDPVQSRFFAVNPGDNTISMMALQNDGTLTLESNVDSGGIDPISITVHGDTVYVVNAGDATTSPATPANISGFTISGTTLTPITNAILPLSADNPGPGQIQFVSGGNLLVVTEKGTSKIDTYTVDASGLAAGPIVHPSAGTTPFGFATTSNGQLVVSEAAGGQSGASTESTYAIGVEKSGLAGISASVASGQSAACWVVLAGGFAYVTNAKTNNVSAYTVGSNGKLAYQWSIDSGAGPIDAALTVANDYLYVLNSKDGSISIYGVNTSTGALTAQTAFTPATALPTSVVGLAVGSKAVYTMSNVAANAIEAYSRGTNGSLSGKLGSYLTGGVGSAGGLGSQGALVLDSSKNLLFAVNAGNGTTDGSLSMMAVNADGSLTLDKNIDSGGIKPVSVTVNGNNVYVVNAGNATTAANISGFQISGTSLNPIANSKLPLSAATPGPAQISFSPDGKLLIVTEKGTNKIDTYAVDGSGVPSGPNAYRSTGTTPFGFAVTANDQVVVSEAFGGMANKSAASSYAIGTTGSLSVISGKIASGQSAACWTVVQNGWAYVTNAKTNNLSGYQIAADGTMTYQWNAATGMKPLDESVSGDGQFLYVLDEGAASFSIYAIKSTGLLTQKPDFTGLPAHAVSVVAR